jgi:hypothetical protein
VKRLGSETIQPLLSTVDLLFGMQDFLLDLRYRLEYAALRLITGLVRAVLSTWPSTYRQEPGEGSL